VRRVVIVALTAVVLLGPGACLTGVALIAVPATARCAPAGVVTVSGVPDRLTATTTTGTPVTLDRVQLGHAATIVQVGAASAGVGRDGILIALMAALTESRLRMLANTGAYPQSATFPHDGDGSDHDSLGLFQMRPAAGWGTVAQLMDPTYQARAFYGGPDGPNRGSPRGLLDIPGWQDLPKGAAAQAVEVSAHPDRYASFQPVAEAILAALTQATHSPAATTPVAETTRVVFPLPDGAWTRTSGFGTRLHPVLGTRRLHAGVDLAAPAGTPILAAADGRVAAAGPADGYGHLIVLEHTIDGQPVATAYAHMPATGIHVAAGDHVTAGQHIGDVGSTGNSTGPHLHFELRPGGPDAQPIDPEPWLQGRAIPAQPAQAQILGCSA
jgi:murein DD-endopeptidase MepM/ murein hydrolase activator NlpD